MLLRMSAVQTTPPAAPGGRRALLTLLLLAGGVALLAWQVRRLNLTLDDLADGFSRVGLWFGAILALSLVRFGVRSYAWMVLADKPLPFATVVAATISGDALGNVTPLGLVASEPAKAYYLRRQMDPRYGLAALTAENFFYSLTVAVYVIVGAAAMLALFRVPPPVHLAGVSALGGMALLLAVAGWLAWRRPSIASNLLGRLPGSKLSRLIERVQAFERETYGAAGPTPRRLAIVTACELSFHALSLVECWLTFWLLSGVTAVLPALIFDGFNRVVNVLFKFVPGRLGVEEGGTALLATAIGYAAHDGFLLGLVRKLRVVVWAAVGLWLWGRRRD